MDIQSFRLHTLSDDDRSNHTGVPPPKTIQRFFLSSILSRVSGSVV